MVDENAELLPVIEINEIEYFVDIDRRQFRAVNDAENTKKYISSDSGALCRDGFLSAKSWHLSITNPSH